MMRYINKSRRFFAVLLTAAMLVMLIPSIGQQRAYALTDRQSYFAELIGSFARADMHKTGILASITVGQAIFESGWGGSRLALEGKNLFGYKAYSTWSGMVYDQRAEILYSNYDDMLISNGNDDRNVSAWRAYSDWRESVEDHSTLLNTSDRYEALRGETDYKKAAYDIVDAGYTSDEGYAEQLIAIIENYELMQYDIITPNEYGVIAMEMNRAQLALNINDGEVLTYEVFKAEFTPTEGSDATDWLPSEVVWESSDPTVAAVDQSGAVSALKEGVALIRAKIGDREACCLVEVAGEELYDAYVTANLYARAEPNAESKAYGIFPKGQGVYLHSEETDGWYLCEGVGRNGEHLKGWSKADYIVINNHKGLAMQIRTAKNVFALAVGDTSKIVYALAPATATQRAVKWTSANEKIATVDSDGVITAVSKGVTTVTGVTSGEATVTVSVQVGDTAKNYTATVTTRLYVRAAPSTDAKALGIIDTDTAVEVIGEETDGWYHVKGTTQNGNAVDGWSKARYINITGVVGGTAPAAVFEFNNQSIVASDGNLYGVVPGSTAEALISSSTSAGEVKLFAANGTQKTADQKMATGDVLVLYYDGVELSRVSVVIRGDVNGDGEIDTADYLFVKRCMVGTLELDELQLVAADASGDGELLVNDYLMIVRHYMGKYTIIQQKSGSR